MAPPTFTNSNNNYHSRQDQQQSKQRRRSKPTYTEIRTLQKQLDQYSGYYNGGDSNIGGGRIGTSNSSSSSSNNVTIKQCRIAYQRLYELLSNPNVRHQLANEAIPDDIYFNHTNDNTGTSSNPNNDSVDVNDNVFGDDDSENEQQDGRSRSNRQNSKTTTTNAKKKSTVQANVQHVLSYQRKALSELWKSIMNSTIYCTIQLLQKSSSSRGKSKTSSTTTKSSSSKYDLQDIDLPHQMIKLCLLMVDPIFENPTLDNDFGATTDDTIKNLVSLSSLSLLPNNFYCATTTTGKEMEYHFLPCKIGKDQVKLIYNYCVDMLSDIFVGNNDTETDNYDEHILQVEEKLLLLLLFLCGRYDIVCYFKSLQQIRTIIVTILQPRIMYYTKRIASYNSASGTGNTATMTSKFTSTIIERLCILCCKILYTLCYTCIVQVGIGCEYNTIECINVLNQYITTITTSYSSSFSSSAISVMTIREEMTYILNTVTLFLRYYPELCVTSVAIVPPSSSSTTTNSNSKSSTTISSFIQQSFLYKQQQPQHITKGPITNWMALLDFVNQYIIVCQLGGKLQGSMPGDIRDNCSLTNKMINMILDVLVKSVVNQFQTLSSTNTSSTINVSKDQQRADQVSKLLLEVTVRVLNIAQRSYLIQKEWEEIENPTQLYIDHIEQQPHPDDYYSFRTERKNSGPTCSITTLSKSPFIQLVLRPIYNVIVSSSTTALPKVIPTNNILHEVLAVIDGDDNENDNSGMEHEQFTASGSNAMISEKTLIAMLHILCTSVELFPLGSCWSVSTQNNWRVLSMDDSENKKDQYTNVGSTRSTTDAIDSTCDLIAMNGCSIQDLVTIVDLLGSLLAQYGSHSSKAEVQRLTLLSLIRLTISTDEFYHSKLSNINCAELANTWKRIWVKLFDANHCYSTMTQTSVTIGSDSDIVLLLLMQIIRYRCTDPPSLGKISFLKERQCDIWNLKVFEQIQLHRQTPLLLLYTSLACVGLNDTGQCSIGKTLQQDEAWQKRLEQYGKGRRATLICYCLHYLTIIPNDIWIENATTTILFACISSLVNCVSIPLCALSLITDDFSDGYTNWIHAEKNVSLMTQQCKDQFELLSSLWSNPLRNINKVMTENFHCRFNLCGDVVKTALRLVHVRAHRRELQHDCNNSNIGSSDINIPSLCREDFESILVTSSNFCSTMENLDNGRVSIYNLPFRKLICKGMLTVILSDRSESRRLDHAFDHTMDVMKDASSLLLSDLIDTKDRFRILTNVNQIMHVVRTEGGSYMASISREVSSVLYDICTESIERYIAIQSTNNITMQNKSHSTFDSESNLSDDDAASNVISGITDKKRKRQNTKQRIKRSKNPTHQSCDRSLMFLMGLMLVELSSSYNEYELIAKQMIGLDVLGELNDSDYSVDILGGVYAISLLTMKAIRFETMSLHKDDTLPSLISKLIQTIRFASSACSTTHVFGYAVCRSVVTLYEQCPWVESLSPHEAKKLVSLISACERQKEWRSLEQRSYLRSQQLEAASWACNAADANLHSEIDPLFGVDFVIPSLSDINQIVRLDSSAAVARAMSHLSEDKVVETVRRRLCPMTDNVDVSYRRWYANKIVSNGLDESVGSAECNVWDSASLPIRYDTLSCWCTIAEYSSTREMLQQIIFDIVLAVVHDPKIEELCFHALLRIAGRCGFPSVDSFLVSEMRNLVQRWLDIGLSLQQLPTMICMPATYQLFLMSGQIQMLYRTSTNRMKFDTHRIRETAIFDFLKRHSKYWFPRIVIHSIKDLTMSGITKDGRRRLLDNEVFKEYCASRYGLYNDDLAKKALRTFVPMVIAEASFEGKNIADIIAKMLQSLLTESVFKSKCSDGSHLCYRRIAEIAGEVVSADAFDAAETIWLLSNLIGVPRKPGQSLLKSAGINIQEMLGFVRFYLDTSQSKRQLTTRWNAALACCRFVLNDGKADSSMEIVCCLNFLSDISILQSYESIHILALKIMQELLPFVPSTSQSKSYSQETSYRNVFRVIMSLHRRYQNDLIECCTALWRNKEKCRSKSNNNISGVEIANGFWNWSTSEASLTPSLSITSQWNDLQRQVPETIVALAISTYEVIQTIIQESKKLDILSEVVDAFVVDDDDFLRCTSLERINCKFCAQRLVLDVPTSRKKSLDNFGITTSIYVGENQKIDTNQTLAELSSLEQFLRSLRDSNEEDKLCSEKVYQRGLIQVLTSYCSSSLPKSIRIAASRCLGEVNILENVQPGDNVTTTNETNLECSIDQDRLLFHVQSRVIDAIYKSVKSSKSQTALVAIDTLKCLMSTKAGRDCVEFISDPELRETLPHFSSKSKMQNFSGLLLSKIEILDLRKLTKEEYADNNILWCWDDVFWEYDPNKSSFQSWICRLAPALLVCCYNMPTKQLGEESSYSFFHICQRLCCLDADVSRAMFTAIILDLLLRDDFDLAQDGIDNVLLDTWIGRRDSEANIRISRCFTLTLRKATSANNLESVQMITELLDILRRYTQYKFVTTNHHKIGKRRNKDLKAENSDNADTADGILWHGAPYGIVLQLDGILVANACICSRNFETALYYVEMFANVCFGGPLCVSNVDVRPKALPTRFISGFSYGEDFNVDINDDAKDYFGILRQCYAALEDDEARKAVDQIESDFCFMKEGHPIAAASMIRDPPSLLKLQHLDNIVMKGIDLGGMREPIVNCLEELGLHGLLETYMHGLIVTTNTYSDFHGALEDSNFLREKLYECRLYTKQWDDPIYKEFEVLPDQEVIKSYYCYSNVGVGFFKHLTDSLNFLQQNDFDASHKHLLNARLCFVDRLTGFGSEGTLSRNIWTSIDSLRTLNDLENFLLNPESMDSLYRIIAPVDFVEGIPINRSPLSDSIRATVLNYARSLKSTWSSMSNTLGSDLELQFNLHLQNNRHQAAHESLQRLESVRRFSSNPIYRLQMRLHEAKLYESREDFNSAIRNTKLVIKSLQQPNLDKDGTVLLADAMLCCGNWMAKYKVEPTSSILTNYIHPSAEQSTQILDGEKNLVNTERATRALLAQGQLVFNLFESVTARISSSDWQRAELSLNEREVECNKLRQECRQRKQSSVTDQMYRHYLEREIQETRAQRNTIVGSLETYRNQVITSISCALAIAGDRGPEDMSKHVYRLLGTLFSSESSWSKSIDDVTNDSLHLIPTFRFVPLINQLLSRISTASVSQKVSFQKCLQTLIQKVSFDHPYHCLIPLITLSESKCASSADSNEKAEGAQLILRNMINNDSEFRSHLVESYKKLSVAYIHLAAANTSDLKQNSTSNIPFDRVCKTSCSRLDKCLGTGARKARYLPCVFTKPPMIRPGKDYGDGIVDIVGSEFVDTFDSTFSITESGVNQPKIVVCIGTNQGRYKQLVKGADDTRQDAVMEQVFGYANEILDLQSRSKANGSKKSSNSNLRLVTYNVVPLSHVAGVLEWVENSIPFGDFIVDKVSKVTCKVGAHSRYYPNDWSSERCRSMLTRIWKTYQDRDTNGNGEISPSEHKENLREAFELIYQHHTPVFRYFFVENFLIPEMWYASKMRYTRSVAVSSIVGHILGIGDRHMSNILVHQKTGEVIHIDFGIVFEQGKRLRIPEIVPFRLTRNIVDGMGPIGVEGTFTKAAEATLSALKENASGLSTILSAIVSDPLYKWTVGSKKGNNKRPGDSENDNEGKEDVDGYNPNQESNNNNSNNLGLDRDDNRNEVAAHAISRIQEKLLGYEDGTAGEQQTVESQVQLLMHAAQDLDNLCMMFIGWAPFQ